MLPMLTFTAYVAAACVAEGGEPPAFQVTSGSCVASGDCVQSPGFGERKDYPNSDSCVIVPTWAQTGENTTMTYNMPMDATMVLVTEKFSTERHRDVLVVNGEPYSGTIGPKDVTPTEEITWTSDESGMNRGWRICARQTQDLPPHSKDPGEPDSKYVVKSSGKCETPITKLEDCDLAVAELYGPEVKSPQTIAGAIGWPAGCLVKMVEVEGMPQPKLQPPPYWNDRYGSEDDPYDCTPEVRCLCVLSKAAIHKYKYLGWVILVATGVCLLSSLLAHKMWIEYERWRMEQSNMTTETEELLKKLLRNFVPSVGVNSHEFKGISKYDHGISIDFTNLGLTLKDGRSVLDGVTGSFPSGNMIAIMGPSGCGKTTCMNVLCGKATYGTMVGEVKINGEVKDVAAFKNVMGFVPQEDTVFDKLTVREQITYSAELRNERTASKNRIDLIVQDVLQVLQVGHIQNSIVGSVEERGISGGQRKRVNVGLELAATPCLLFLDEPTSGLDSTSSFTIINSLKKMTELNMTIVMVIHQPRYSLFTLFDQVLLLGKGGRTVYQGPAAEAAAHFESLHFVMPERENPADWLMDVIEGQVENTEKAFTAQDLFDAWEARAGSGGQAIAGAPSSRKIFTPEESSLLDLRVVQANVDDQWTESNKVDVEGFLPLLNGCAGGETSQPVAKALFEMASGSQEYLKRQQLVAFIVGQVEKRSHREESSAWDAGHAKEDSEALLATETASLERVRPGVFRQFRVVLHRRAVQFWRNWKRRALDMFIIAVTALLVGYRSLEEVEQPKRVLFYQLGIALLTTVSCLATFSDRALIWRESSTGISLLALYMGRVWVNFLDVATQIVLYTCIYYAYTTPYQKHPLPLMEYLAPTFCLVWTTSGWGYLLSLLIPPGNAVVAGAAIILILCGILPDPDNLVEDLNKHSWEEGVLAFSPVRWSGFMIQESYDSLGSYEKPLPTCADTFLAGATKKLLDAYKGAGFGLDNYWSAAAVLMVYGAFLRLLSLMVLSSLHKKV